MRIPRHFQLFFLICILTIAPLSFGQGSLGFQITPDHQGALYFPSMDPPLTQVWSTFLGGGVVSYPIIVGTRIFVVVGYSNSVLYALDAGTGKVLWAQQAPSGYGGWVGAAYDNGVLFAVPYDVPGLNNGAIFAYSAADGALLWRATLPGQSFFTSAPTAVNGVVYTSGAESGGTVYAVQESNGQLLWTQSVENGDSSAPAVTSDGVYVSYACPQTYKFNPTTGAQIWHFSGQCEGGGGDSVAIYDGQVYVRDLYNYPTDGITLNANNGIYSGGFNSHYSPAFWQGTAFYTEASTLTAVDLSTSQTLWTGMPQSGDSYSCAPIVVNGVVYAGTTAGNVYGYSATDGSTVFSTNVGQSISCTEYSEVPLPGLSAGNGMLLVPASSYLVAFRFTNFGAWQFVPVKPCRVVDTRQTGNPIQGGASQNYPVTQLGSCGIPINATAFSLNVTVAPHEHLGYLTIWPTGQSQPTVSTMNSPDGRTKANAAIVPSGFDSGVSVYASNTTDVILDIDGYFLPQNSQSLQFYPLPPCRVVDTRSGSTQPQGLGPPSLQAKKQRDLPILKSPCLSGINGAQAYSFNVTAAPNPSGQKLDYLTVWPSDQPQPTVSTLNNPTATVVANAAIVPAAPDGDIDVYAYNSTDLIIDINGYFAAPRQSGLSMYPIAPCRVLDTRSKGGPFQKEKTVNVVNSACAPPSTAQAYIFNATVVPPGQMPYLTLWPDGKLQPVVSTLNAYDGLVTSNMAIVPAANGAIDAYAAGSTQLILDISGYFAP